MKLRKLEREGEVTQVRVMMNEKLTKRVDSYLLYYLDTYKDAIDTREFAVLAFEAILDADKDFHAWLKRQEVKPAKPVVNGKDSSLVQA